MMGERSDHPGALFVHTQRVRPATLGSERRQIGLRPRRGGHCQRQGTEHSERVE